MPITARLWAVLAAGTVFARTASAGPPEPPIPWPAPNIVVLTLRPAVVLGRPQARIADVASLEGGPLLERQKIAALDVLDLPGAGAEVTVLRAQITYRLLLAGIEANRFRLQGADAVRVSLAPQPALEAEVVAVARQELRLHLPGPPENYSVKLAQPVRLPVLPANRANLRFQGELAAKPAVPGRVRVDVAVYDQGARVAGLSVFFDVRSVGPELVVLQRIEAGDVLSADKVRALRASPVGPSGPRDTLNRWIGQRTRRALEPGHAVGPEDIEDGTAPAPVLIKQRDIVQLVVRVGALKVSARGEALQDGRRGDRIRVRNVDSNTVIQGRVVDRSIVEVDN